jgi:hypothetical protein
MEKEYISGEAHREMVQQKSKAQNPRSLRLPLLIGLIIVLIVVAFIGGSQYQNRNNSNSSNPATQTQNNGAMNVPSSANGNGGNSGNGAITGGQAISGQVSSISATSITVQASGGAKTLSITSSTSIISGNTNQTVTYSDIKNGDMVIVIPSGSDSSKAINILINPHPNSSGTLGQ